MWGAGNSACTGESYLLPAGLASVMVFYIILCL